MYIVKKQGHFIKEYICLKYYSNFHVTAVFADPPSPVLFVSRFPYDLTVTQLKHTFPGCTAASIVPRKPKRKPKPKKPRALTPRQMKKKVVSTRNPTKARKWKPPSDDDVGLGR